MSSLSLLAASMKRRIEGADLGHHADLLHPVDPLGSTDALRSQDVDVDGVLVLELSRGAARRPEVHVEAQGITEGPDEVRRVLHGHLLAQGRQLLPGGGHRVAELVHERLVVVGDALRDVVGEADEPAVRADALADDVLLELVEQLLRHVRRQVHGPVVARRGRHGDEIGTVEDDVRPALAGVVGERDLGRDLEDVHDLGVHQVGLVRMRRLPGLDGWQARLVEPDDDRGVLVPHQLGGRPRARRGRLGHGCPTQRCDRYDRQRGGQQVLHKATPFELGPTWPSLRAIRMSSFLTDTSCPALLLVRRSARARHRRDSCWKPARRTTPWPDAPPDPELGLDPDVLGARLTLSTQTQQQSLGGHATHLLRGLVDRRDGWLGDGEPLHVIDAHDGDVPGTSRPASAMATSAPMVMTLFVTKMALGRRGSARSAVDSGASTLERRWSPR